MWNPFKAARLRREDREGRWMQRDAVWSQVEAELRDRPFRVTENADGTWCAWRSRMALPAVGFSLHHFPSVDWRPIERAEALPTREEAERAVRRVIAGESVALDAEGREVATQEG